MVSVPMLRNRTTGVALTFALVCGCGCGPKVDSMDGEPFRPGRTCTARRSSEGDHREESRVERDGYGRVTRFESVRTELDLAWFFGFRRAYGEDGTVVETQIESTNDEVSRTTIRYRLDGAGRVLSESGPELRLEHRYDEEGRLAATRNLTRGTVRSFRYPDDERIEIWSGRDGAELHLETTVRLDTRGRVLEEIEASLDAAPERRRVFTRGPHGGIVEVVEREGDRIRERQRCISDARGRIASCTWDLGPGRRIESRATYHYERDYGDHPCSPEAMPSAYIVDR